MQLFNCNYFLFICIEILTQKDDEVFHNTNTEKNKEPKAEPEVEGKVKKIKPKEEMIQDFINEKYNTNDIKKTPVEVS